MSPAPPPPPCFAGSWHREAGVTVHVGHPRAARRSLGRSGVLLGWDARLLWVSFLGWVRRIQAVMVAEGTSSPLQSLCPARHSSLCGREREITTVFGAARVISSFGESPGSREARGHASRELELLGFAQSPLLHGPRGVCGPQVEARCPDGWVFARWRWLRAGRDPVELSGSCDGCGWSPGTRRIPLPGAGSGIGLGYYSNAAFLLN